MGRKTEPEWILMMYGVFSHTGQLLGTFYDFQTAALACRAWGAACVHYLGALRIDR